MIEAPITKSLLDTDWYKFTQCSVVSHFFPDAEVVYTFINRGKTPFPMGFEKKLKTQISLMSQLQMTIPEQEWMKQINYIRPTFVEWLAGYHFNPSEVEIFRSDSDEQLHIKIQGPWYRTILWEVPLMALISELYFKEMGYYKKSNEWKLRIKEKATYLQDENCHWIDFGTRRRYSYAVQNEVVKTMKDYKGFLGTSNPRLAYEHNVVAQGTLAHELVMGISGIFGPNMANKLTMKYWSKYFQGNLGVMLSDTFTTDAFLKDFDRYEACLFDGVRQDSGDPIKWGIKMLNHYKALNIHTNNKRFVFSDNLTPNKFAAINDKFKHVCQPIAGIGTNFTNDCFSDEQKDWGIKPLNIVIKLSKIRKNKNSDWVDVTKLSDDISKATGTSNAIRKVKEELNIE
jgi:nicotinate phosphoribosyltransferase